MKKVQFLLLLAVTSLLFAQAPKWVIGSSLIDFSGTPSIINSSLLGAAGPANGAFDKNGNLLFYVKAGTIYNINGSSLAAFGGLPALPNELSIVNVPATCNRFYIMGIFGGPVGTGNYVDPVYLRYTMVEVNNGVVSIVSNFNNINLGIISDGRAGLAVTKLRKNKTRFLFTLGKKDGLKRFLITNNGINLDNAIGFFTNSDPYELDIYEDPASGNIKLAWGDTNVGLNVATLNNQGNYVTHIVPTIVGLDKIYGIEFIDDHRLVFGTSRTYYVTPQQMQTVYQVGVFDFAGNYTLSYISNSDAYYNSHIERATDGKFYTSKEYYVSGTLQGYKLGSIDYNNLTITEVPNLIIPAMLTSWTRLLPDQIDNENYSTANSHWDLAAYDNSGDIGAEPYVPSSSNWDVWKSDDIWNRKTVNGLSLTNESPGYSTDPAKWNVMRFRIRNIGCEESPENRVRLYWTMGATGETWDVNAIPFSPPSSTALNAWDGSKCIMNPSTSCIPAGGEITQRSLTFNSNAPDYDTSNPSRPGFIVPPLQPGQEIIIDAKWQPKDPAVYGDPGIINNPMICFLGRIVDVNDPMYGEYTTDALHPFRDNIKNNNNIVTRNSTVVPLGIGEGLALKVKGSIFVGNSTLEPRAVNIKLDKVSEGNQNFGGIGKIILTLDNMLWAKWKEGGSKGEGIQILNPEKHEIQVIDFNHVRLNNIMLEKGEHRGINLSFELNQPTNIIQVYQYAMSQSFSDAPDEEYGSVCNYLVEINTPQQSGQPILEGGSDGSTSNASTFKGDIKLSPNPSSEYASLNFELTKENKLTIQLIDIYGKTAKVVDDNKLFNEGINAEKFSTSELPDGMYFVIITTGGEQKSLQLVVKH